MALMCNREDWKYWSSTNDSFMSYMMWYICPLNPRKTLRLSKNQGKWKSYKVLNKIILMTFGPIIVNLVCVHFQFQSFKTCLFGDIFIVYIPLNGYDHVLSTRILT
jgi:hypothetical protein